MGRARLFTPSRAVCAFVVSPLVAPLLFVASGMLRGRGVEVSWVSATVYAFVIGVHAYAAALLLGLPMFLLRPRRSGTAFLVAGGAVAGVVVAAVLWLVDWVLDEPGWLLALSTASGATAGFVFSRFGGVTQPAPGA